MKKLLFILTLFIIIGCQGGNHDNQCKKTACTNDGYHECVNNFCILSKDRCETKNDCKEGFECNDEHSCFDPLAPCENQTCSNHGECIVDNNEAKCKCEENYHVDGLTCVSNSKKIECINVAPENAISTVTKVDVTWNSETNSWSKASNCEWLCKDSFHTEDNLSCISNSKMIQCADIIPENSKTNIVEVDINWNNETNSWTEADCQWRCKPLYEKKENSCIIMCEDAITNIDDNYAYYKASKLTLTEEVTVFENLTTSSIDSETDECIKSDDWYMIKNVKVGDIIKVDLLFVFNDDSENLDLEFYIGGIDNLVGSSYTENSTESITYAIQEKDIPDNRSYTDLHIKVTSGKNNYTMTVTKKNLCEDVTCTDRKICIANSFTEHSCICSKNYFTEGDQCTTPCDALDCSGSHKYCHQIDQENAECRCDDEYSLNGDKCEKFTLADTCEDITFTINSSGVFVGSTWGKSDDYQNTNCTSMNYEFDGLDVAYKIELEAGNILNLTLHQTSSGEAEDIAFYMVRNCISSNSTCVMGSDLGLGSTDETGSYTVTETGIYYIIVDSVTEDADMPDYYDYELTINLQ